MGRRLGEGSGIRQGEKAAGESEAKPLEIVAASPPGARRFKTKTKTRFKTSGQGGGIVRPGPKENAEIVGRKIGVGIAEIMRKALPEKKTEK